MKTEKTMTDAQGQTVPLKYVKQYDRERDRLARRCLKRFRDARAALERVYADTLEDIEMLESLAGKDGKPLGGIKGNLQFCSFDGLIQVYRMARYEIRFDERLQVARDLIYGVIDAKAQGLDEDLAGLIRQIFEPNADGMLSQSRVMGLFRFKVKSPDWARAMDLIRESIGTKRGKTLIGVQVKPGREGEWQAILLDIAKCAGIPAEVQP